MTHYEALELPENASAADIRRAYRRLVLLTHPDRTPDPAAHARYLTINSAYETLSDPGRRATYDFARRAPLPAPEPSSPGRARDRARRPTAPTRPQRTPAREPFAAEYARMFRLARPILLGCLLLCTSIGLDLLLAREQSETVLRTDGVAYRRIMHYTTRGRFMQEEEVPVGTQLLVTRAPLWRTVISAQVVQTGEELRFGTVYQGAGIFFSLCLALTASISLLPRLGNEPRLMATLAAALFLLVTLVMVFAN